MGLIKDLGIRPPGRHPFSSVVDRLTATRQGAWVLSRTLRHLDRLAQRLSGGRVTVTEGVTQLPSVFLTTTGARTGRARVAQLIAIPFGDNLAVIGSNFGQSKHPGWVHNLAKDPHCTVSHGGTSLAVVATKLKNAEAERVWATARELYRGFAIYPELAGQREIHVFALEPVRGR